jgi:hypothetical protein
MAEVGVEEHVRSTFYGWQRWPGDEHKSGWTRETLWEAIHEAGFEEIQDGVQHYLELGFDRGRFHRPHDAHLYPKAVKKGHAE